MAALRQAAQLAWSTRRLEEGLRAADEARKHRCSARGCSLVEVQRGTPVASRAPRPGRGISDLAEQLRLQKHRELEAAMNCVRQP